MAAAACKPPAPNLTWDDVVNYAFLADFDLLRDMREDVHSKPWALQVNRVLRDQYFKIERTWEEIDRLNIKIHRLITYITNKTIFLKTKEESLAGGVMINTLYVPMRRYPVCFSLLLYCTATLPMLD